MNLEEIINNVANEFGSYNFNCLALAHIDFKKKSYESYSLYDNPFLKGQKVYFDLASLTKPLTLGFSYLRSPELFNDDMKLLLNHRGGLKAWGRLSRDSWRKQVSSYAIKESDTVYSDFGALRLQLEIEKKENLYDLVSPMWDEEIVHWLDIEDEICAPTGRRQRQLIDGEVHDDNAYVIGEKVSHAGLFGTIDGVCRTLLKAQESYSLIQNTKRQSDHRFINGWDSVSNSSNTLAGSGATTNTFGHLGFTGTSMWITPETNTGVVLLCNEVLGYWNDRAKLNALRRSLEF
ncbi:serine hydrolase [Halobacteriovorax sp.]|uniref:serine hydrolase n=1 Tax=Halobacteriovorax sp. TaxID=2020862 RepID=UPI003AF1E84D